jgi:hypothetical protein
MNKEEKERLNNPLDYVIREHEEQKEAYRMAFGRFQLDVGQGKALDKILAIASERYAEAVYEGMSDAEKQHIFKNAIIFACEQTKEESR